MPRGAPPKRRIWVPMILGTITGLALGYYGLAVFSKSNCLLQGGEWKAGFQHCDMARMKSDWKIYMREQGEALRRIKPVEMPEL